MSNWTTIESDPGVFTSLIESFGVKNAQLTELWSLDDDSLSTIIQSYGKVYGLVFLFKWQGNEEAPNPGAQPNTPLSFEDAPQDLFFARQVITNACATQAILSILLNTNPAKEGDTDDDTGLKLGETLSSLKDFTTSFPADLKGEAIGASDEIRTAHNSFARRETFLMDDSKKRIATADDDVFHFIAYVPHNDGIVYELDGLQPGPIPVGNYIQETNAESNDFPWLSVARQAIQSRIEKYAASEIKFNLMALTRDKRTEVRSKIEKNQDNEALIQELNMELVAEEELREQWKDENERRRHNYLPLCMELLKALASSGNLRNCTQKANEKRAETRKQRLG